MTDVEHLSDFTLDRLHADEAFDGVTAARDHLSTCTGCQARRAQMLSEQEAFVPDADLLARLSLGSAPAKLVRPRVSRRWRGMAAATTALAASVAIFLFVRGPSDDGVRLRGVVARFFVVEADGSAPRPVSDLARVPSGALISLEVQGSGSAIAVWYVRPGKSADLIYPSPTRDAAQELQLNGAVRLLQPIVLDNDRQSGDVLRIAVCMDEGARARALAGDEQACSFVDERVSE